MKNSVLVVLGVCVLWACTTESVDIQKPTEEFLQYQLRANADFTLLEKVLDENLVYHDFVADEKRNSSYGFISMLAETWQDSLRKIDTPNKEWFKVNTIFYKDNQAVIRGVKFPNTYNGYFVDSIDFMYHLYFNNQQKIVKIEEWNDYSVQTLESIIQFRQSVVQ